MFLLASTVFEHSKYCLTQTSVIVDNLIDYFNALIWLKDTLSICVLGGKILGNDDILASEHETSTHKGMFMLDS